MMQKTSPLLLATLILFAVGCNQKTSKSTNTTTTNSNGYNYLNGGANGGTTSGTTTGSTTSGTTSGSTTGGTTSGSTTGGTSTPKPWIGDLSCSGATTDGGGNDCSGFTNARGSLPTYQIYIAGSTIWKPGLSWSGANGPSSYFPNSSEMAGVLNTDAVLKLRFRIMPQSIPNMGVQGCYNRGPLVSTNPDKYQSPDWTVPYRQLRFEVGVVPRVLADQGNFPGQYFQTVEDSSGKGISVCKCSEFLDFSSTIDRSYNEHVVVIRQIQDDLECRANGLGCPAHKVTKQKHCVGFQMQIKTDQTPYSGY